MGVFLMHLIEIFKQFEFEQKLDETIDKLEKTEIQTNQYTRYTEYFALFLLIGLFFLFVEVLLSHTRFMKIP